MTPELAAKLDAAVCKVTPGKPLHLTREMVVELLEMKERTGDTLRWLRQYLDTGTDVSVPAREAWNRICPRYYDRNQPDPDELA